VATYKVGGGMFHSSTMHSILAQISPGDVVEFAPGAHVVGVIRLNGVSLTAARPGTASIKGQLTYSGHATITGLTVDGRVNLVDQARVTIARSVLRNAADNLLVARGYSQATLVDCDLSGSSTTHPALYAEEGATIVLRQSHLHDVPRDGAQVFDGAVLEVQDSRITSCGGAAARADRGGKILLTRSSIHGFPQNAIVGQNASVVHADGCEFWDANSAIAVTGRSTATVTGSKFRDLRGNGVYVAEAATAAISAGAFADTIYPAVAVVGEGSVAELATCLIERCGVKWPGLWVDDAATATIRATRV